jgi:hypothetical protein
MQLRKLFSVFFLSEVELLHGATSVKIILPFGQGIFRFRRIWYAISPMRRFLINTCLFLSHQKVKAAVALPCLSLGKASEGESNFFRRK